MKKKVKAQLLKMEGQVAALVEALDNVRHNIVSSGRVAAIERDVEDLDKLQDGTLTKFFTIQEHVGLLEEALEKNANIVNQAHEKLARHVGCTDKSLEELGGRFRRSEQYWEGKLHNIVGPPPLEGLNRAVERIGKLECWSALTQDNLEEILKRVEALEPMPPIIVRTPLNPNNESLLDTEGVEIALTKSPQEPSAPLVELRPCVGNENPDWPKELRELNRARRSKAIQPYGLTPEKVAAALALEREANQSPLIGIGTFEMKQQKGGHNTGWEPQSCEEALRVAGENVKGLEKLNRDLREQVRFLEGELGRAKNERDDFETRARDPQYCEETPAPQDHAVLGWTEQHGWKVMRSCSISSTGWIFELTDGASPEPLYWVELPEES